MDNDPRHFIWTEKYRPTVIDDCILPEHIKAKAKGYVKAGRVPTMLMSGGPGMGKTTLARCIANELGSDFMVINASLERNIDMIRTKVMNFASTVSFDGEGKGKITLLDEADGLTPLVQESLRAFIEQFAGNHSIILTANNKNKLIPALHSRCQSIDFKITKVERPQLCTAFFKRVLQVLDHEKIEYDKRVVAEVVNHFFPDFRRCLNELQKHASGGKIDASILVSFSDESFNDLILQVRSKKFNEIRKWAANNSDTDSDAIFKMFYDKASDKLESKSIPALVMLLADYQFKASFVANQEINLVSFLTELMLSPDMHWK